MSTAGLSDRKDVNSEIEVAPGIPYNGPMRGANALLSKDTTPNSLSTADMAPISTARAKR